MNPDGRATRTWSGRKEGRLFGWMAENCTVRRPADETTHRGIGRLRKGLKIRVSAGGDGGRTANCLRI